MIRRSRPFLFAFFLLLAALARGQDPLPVHIDEANLYFNLKSPYAALSLAITNPTSRRIAFDIVGSDTSGGNRVTTVRGESIEPGASRIVHIPVFGSSFGMSIVLRGANGQVVPSYANGKHFEILHVAPVASWASEAQLIDYQANQKIEAPAPNYGNEYYPTASPATRTGTGAATPPIPKLVEQIAPEHLPDFWLCLTPFSRVVLDEGTFRSLPASQAQALNEWVDSGGELELYSASKEESRLQLLGSVYSHPGNPFLDPTSGKARTSPPQAWSRFYGESGDIENAFPHQVRELGGRSGGLALASLFFVVGGPVNHFYFRRRKQPRAILLSLPALSILFCLVISGYFILFRGFSRQGGTYSMSVLDEATDAGFIVGRHTVLSGLYPMGGFHFSPKTAFFPLHRLNGDFQLEQGKGTILHSGLFQPSINFHYFTAAPFQSRERLVVDPGAKTVVNGFETPIASLILRTADGSLFRAKDLKAGAKGDLEPIAQKASSSAVADPANVLWNAFYNERPDDGFARTMHAFAPPEQPGRIQYLIAFDGARPGAAPGVRISKGGESSLLFGLGDDKSAGESQSAAEEPAR